MRILTHTDKRILLNALAVGTIHHANIKDIMDRPTKDDADDMAQVVEMFSSWIADLEQLKINDPEAFNAPYTPDIARALTPDSRDKIKQILKQGYITDRQMTDLDFPIGLDPFMAEHTTSDSYLEFLKEMKNLLERVAG